MKKTIQIWSVAGAIVVLIGVVIGVVQYERPVQQSANVPRAALYQKQTHPDAGIPVPPQSQASASDTGSGSEGIFAFQGFIDAIGTNRWRGMVNGKEMDVYAGAPKNDQAQGVLWVQRTNGTAVYFDTYPTPTKHGILRIIQENHGQLTLKAADGTPFVFDLLTNEFTH